MNFQLLMVKYSVLMVKLVKKHTISWFSPSMAGVEAWIQDLQRSDYSPDALKVMGSGSREKNATWLGLGWVVDSWGLNRLICFWISWCLGVK